MSEPRKFRIELKGVFHTCELYDINGREIFELARAVDEAERQYGENWTCVYNGNEALSREETLHHDTTD